MKILEDNKNILISDYIAGKTASKLAKEYNVSSWSITNFLKENNIKIRSIQDLKIKFDENFFFRECHKTYYFWGFILGDGCLITHKQGHKYITISLKDTDKCILLNFCKYIKINKSHIKTYSSNKLHPDFKYVRLEFYGNFFKSDFSKFGIVSNKTYNPVIPNISTEFIKSFLLGLIDADGSVAWKKPRTNNIYPNRKTSFEHSISLVGHPLIMNWVINQFRLLGFNGNINTQMVKGKWKRIRIQRKNDVFNLAKILELEKYYNLCLKRKWENLYKEIKSQ